MEQKEIGGLYKDESAKAEFKKYMETKRGECFISYAALAECRALNSLGISLWLFNGLIFMLVGEN